jgi:hypothetical protein
MKRLNDINQKWEFQRQHVRWFIDHCPCCQKMSMLKIPLHAHGFSTSTYTPMECLNVDFVGPFQDCGYIFVIIDTFTRWVELFTRLMQQLLLLLSAFSALRSVWCSIPTSL